MAGEKRKDGVSTNIRIGEELFEMLIEYCAATGQSKTVAVERAIEAYCNECAEEKTI